MAPGRGFAWTAVRLEIQVQQIPEVPLGDTTFTARCFICGNRYGLVNLMVLASGALCCRRCRRGRRFRVVATLTGAVSVVE